MTAYDPKTGQTKPQTITHVFVNHDSDRLDVTLALPATGSAAPSQTAAQDATAVREQRALLMSHGRRGPPNTNATSSASGTPDATIHTTANHPWLTRDRGWVRAGGLRPGEQVVTLPGASAASRTTDATTSSGTATVARVHVMPGAAEMDNLTVAQDHTYVVGARQPCPTPLLRESLAYQRIAAEDPWL